MGIHSMCTALSFFSPQMTLCKYGNHFTLYVPVARLLSIYFYQRYKHSKGSNKGDQWN
jgi:hypothetical protein